MKPINFSKVLTAMCAVGLLSLPMISSAEFNVEHVDFNYSDENAVQVRNKTKQLVNLHVRPVKRSYRVNEPMQFKIKGDKDYYLYVFQKDPATGKYIKLIPNNYTKDHYLQAGRTYTIPGTAEFASDRPGTEVMHFVATAQPLNLNRGGFQPMGEMFHSAGEGDIQSALFSIDPNAVLVRPIGSGTDNHRSNAKNKVQTVKVRIY